jgi:hypothetical protein
MAACTRLLIVAFLLLAVFPADADADWLLIPFLGSAFGGDTNFVDLERGVGQSKVVMGGSAALLSDRVFGLEADFGYSPRFFERDARGGLVVNSRVSTLAGSVIVAVPLAVTRESLRPYIVGGLGLMHAKIEDVLMVFPVDKNLLALNIGGGAMGFLTYRTGLRFEIRQFQNLRRGTAPPSATGPTRLSFWRATAGVILRY